MVKCAGTGRRHSRSGNKSFKLMNITTKSMLYTLSTVCKMLHVGGIGFNYQADVGMRFLSRILGSSGFRVSPVVCVAERGMN